MKITWAVIQAMGYIAIERKNYFLYVVLEGYFLPLHAKNYIRDAVHEPVWLVRDLDTVWFIKNLIIMVITIADYVKIGFLWGALYNWTVKRRKAYRWFKE